MKRGIVRDDSGKDISDNIELKNGKSNPFGWSQYEIHYQGRRIGWLENGDFDMDDGFSAEIIEESNG